MTMDLLPEDRLLAQEDAETVDRAVSELPELWRMLVRLSVMEGWPLSFLAPCLNQPEMKLDQELSKALAALRLKLGSVLA